MLKYDHLSRMYRANEFSMINLYAAQNTIVFESLSKQNHFGYIAIRHSCALFASQVLIWKIQGNQDH